MAAVAEGLLHVLPAAQKQVLLGDGRGLQLAQLRAHTVRRRQALERRPPLLALHVQLRRHPRAVGVRLEYGALVRQRGASAGLLAIGIGGGVVALVVL